MNRVPSLRLDDVRGWHSGSRFELSEESQIGPRVDVLVVDDNPDIRSSFAEILRGAGFSVLTAEDGQAALDLIRGQAFGVVLLDMRMPRKNGEEVLEELESPPPVVLISAYTLDWELRTRFGSKVVSYLQKPVSPHKLLPLVAGIVWSE